MKNNASVHKFNIWYLNADGTYDYDFRQERYVVATSEEEAEKKLDAHRKQAIKNGFADFRFVYMGVELDTVII